MAGHGLPLDAAAGCLEYGSGITAVDSGFMRPWLAAVYLIVERGRAAIVDTATNASVPRVLAALEARGIAPAQVDHVILTHIHLDHAGGAGLLMAKLPHARLFVHPRGVRHMVDPSRLVQGTIAVYGAEHAREVYGDVLPVAPERIVAAGEGASIDLAGRVLSFLDTPGHAGHHCCIHDGRTGHVFTGDTFGVAYRELEAGGRYFVFPTTSPVQFDPLALHRSIDRIVALRPGAVYVTHFGRVAEVERLAADLHRLVDAHVALARACSGAGERRHVCLREGVAKLVAAEARERGWGVGGERALEVFASDIELNAQGLGVWLDASAAQS